MNIEKSALTVTYCCIWVLLTLNCIRDNEENTNLKDILFHLPNEGLESHVMMTMMNCFVVWLTDERRLALFPAGTIVRDPHHLESPTRNEQDLNLCRT